MPASSPEKNREYVRRHRAKRRAERARAKGIIETPVPPQPALLDHPWPDDPARALAHWSETKLRVPAGHPLAGSPMTLPPYGVEFIRDVFTHREALNCMARKNSKSGIVAVLLLAHLCGPLARKGWRAGVASVNKGKAYELVQQMRDIVEASKLDAPPTFYRSPAPGRVVGRGGVVDILAADASSGHAAGYDVVVVDELGLLKEKHRAYVNGLRSSVSARNGRFVALTIWGSGPFVGEIVARREDPNVAVHLYQAPEGCAVDDESAWHAANPGLALGIKAMDHMRGEAARVLATPSDEADYRSHELNSPGAPSVELVLSPVHWTRCEVDELPPRSGPVILGCDLGLNLSMSAIVALWPATGRMEWWAALPSIPSLAKRAKSDRAGAVYELAHRNNELILCDGEVVDVRTLVDHVSDELAGEEVLALGADRRRRPELVKAVREAGLGWRVIPRGIGAGHQADGSADIRAFQRQAIRREIAAVPGVLMVHALRSAYLRKDPAGNPAIDRQHVNARIDTLQAAVIACGLREALPKQDGHGDGDEEEIFVASA